ncbi:MAG: type II secretion system F family protein [Catenulispora sp.]|nr:type II secretion system F family protein [Catenulispora sp.]
MTAGQLLALLTGTVLVSGLVLLAVGIRGTDAPKPDGNPLTGAVTRWPRLGESPEQTARRREVQLALCAVGVPAMWLATGWFTAAVLFAAGVFAVPWLLAPTRSHKGDIDRLEALAEWTRHLSTQLQNLGIEQAIKASLRSCPPALQKEVSTTVARLNAGWDPADAVRAFAAEIGDATGDKVCAALLLSLADRGRGLSRDLSDLSDALLEAVSMRREIEAERAKARTTVRWMLYFIVGATCAGLLDRSYMKPYTTFTGHLVLIGLVGALVGIFIWLRTLVSDRPTPRFLVADPRSPVKRPGRKEVSE